MRLPLSLTIAFVALIPAAAPTAEPEKGAVDLSGEIGGRGLLLGESDKAIYRIRLTARVDPNGEGPGTLVLDPSPDVIDEFGFPVSRDALPPVKLDCSLRFVKRKKILMNSPATGIHNTEVEWRLFAITGPKITSRLSLATEAGAGWSSARLLVSDEDGKRRVSVTVLAPQPLPPCHPGCFPAGTTIHVPGGTRAIEGLRAGDAVMTLGPDGTIGQETVTSIFATRNRLIEVRTEGGTLATTETQPLSLVGGGLRAAGALQAGDSLQTWDGRERRTVAVRSVADTGREAQVFNLVLGEPVLFVAGGFLARSKPPAPATDSVQP